MPTSTPRYDLLQTRSARLSAAVRRLGKADPRAIPNIRLAVWRLREVLPILQIEPKTVRKLDTRLRKLVRRLAKLREIDAHLALIGDLTDINRNVRQAIIRVANDLHGRRTKTGEDVLQEKVAAAFRSPLRKVNATLQVLSGVPDSGAAVRPTRWVLKARAARRAATLKQAVDAAGSVYLPGRLRDVRTAVRKFRFGAELLSDVAASGLADVKTIEQTQDILDQLRDTEVLIGRIRRIQDALPLPDVRARQELDALVRVLEDGCRRLHARYVRDRSSLVALCDRLGARALGQTPARREAS
jgi:CHAD domain-containing protein